MIIIGESALELKSGKYIIEEFKKFLKENNLITKEWNALNFLPQNASTVGLIDLKILAKEDEEKFTFFEFGGLRGLSLPFFTNFTFFSSEIYIQKPFSIS